jgi:SPP1 family predicted phage head-tail adaptor
MTLAAGAMDRRVEFLVSTELRRGRGGHPVREWVVNNTVGQVWAYKRSVRQDEQFESSQMQQVDAADFMVRWIPNIETHWRLREKDDYRGSSDKDYDIISIQEMGRRESLVLRCVSGLRVE